MTGHKLRKRSVGNVLDEIAEVLATFPEARSIFFEGRHADRGHRPLPGPVPRHHGTRIAFHLVGQFQG